jgi:predicted lactoylglutathione lyase
VTRASRSGREAVDAFFEAALANGGSVRGEPGVWTQYSDWYYAAFVNDLHGNSVEAVSHAPGPWRARRDVQECLSGAADRQAAGG